MKRVIIKSIALVLCMLTICTLITACASPTDKYMGVWYATKIVTGSTTVPFGEIVKGTLTMEMTIEFSQDGTYIIHYYVNGKEGKEYPQTGTYKVDDDTLVMSNGGKAYTVDGELRIEINGSVQYFTRSDSQDTSKGKVGTASEESIKERIAEKVEDYLLIDIVNNYDFIGMPSITTSVQSIGDNKYQVTGTVTIRKSSDVKYSGRYTATASYNPSTDDCSVDMPELGDLYRVFN